MGKLIQLDTNFYSTGTSWWKKRTETIKHKYMNGEINTNPTDFFTDMKSEDVYMKDTMPIVLIGSVVGGLLLSLMLGIF